MVMQGFQLIPITETPDSVSYQSLDQPQEIFTLSEFKVPRIFLCQQKVVSEEETFSPYDLRLRRIKFLRWNEIGRQLPTVSQVEQTGTS